MNRGAKPFAGLLGKGFSEFFGRDQTDANPISELPSVSRALKRSAVTCAKQGSMWVIPDF
jgi:hypothetical protein